MTVTLVALMALAPAYTIDSIRLRFTHFAQTGLGYQSAAGPAGGPGSEWLRVEQPQAEVTAHLGERVTQRLWVPLDAVTAASPDHSRFGKPFEVPVDAVSTASRATLAGSLNTLTSYRVDAVTEVSFRAAFHLEEPFESWTYGLGVTRSFAEDNTVVGASVNQIVDWFDRFDITGARHGRATRSTSNLNLSVTQVLSATTLASVSYGGTLQLGTLGNTWSSVLLADGQRGEERLPGHRQRHALAGRVSQWLPWQGALGLMYRAYVDDWGIVAHTAEGTLTQRLLAGVHVRGTYRVHWQSAPGFFTTSAEPTAGGFRTADSDLGRLVAQTFGGAASWDVALTHALRDLHVDFGYEHYVRTDHLTVDITTCGMGFRF